MRNGDQGRKITIPLTSSLLDAGRDRKYFTVYTRLQWGGHMGDLGAALRAAREAAGMSLARLASRTHYSKSLLGHLETGEREAKLEHAVAYSKALAVSLETLYISPGDYGGLTDLGISPEEFMARATGEVAPPAEIGWGDVEEVRSTTQAVALSENRFGGGSCETGVGQLQWAKGLLTARASNDVRRSMFEAVGNLSSVVAFAAFDIGRYEVADQSFGCKHSAGVR